MLIIKKVVNLKIKCFYFMIKFLSINISYDYYILLQNYQKDSKNLQTYIIIIKIIQNMEPDNQQIHQPQHSSQQNLNAIEQKPTLPKSKKQIKKQLKKQKWQEMKKQKRQKQREKEKEKRKARKLEQKQNGSVVEKAVQKFECTKKRKDQYVEKMLIGLRVVIDLQFYHLMTEKQRNSLIKQLSYCHSVNRKYQKPFNFILTSSNEQISKEISNKYHADKWGISILQQSITDKFQRQQLVYLSGDAQEQLQKFDQKEVYIIGGIVDHNRLKKITYDYAMKEKIKCRRLPMDGVRLKASVHLAVNHIWQWMLKVYNGDSWGHAIQQIIPSRKIFNKETQQKSQHQQNPKKQEQTQRKN